jgi:ribosomal protein L44E
MRGAQAADFRFRCALCWKAAGKYQGGRAQKIVLNGDHLESFSSVN